MRALGGAYGQQEGSEKSENSAENAVEKPVNSANSQPPATFSHANVLAGVLERHEKISGRIKRNH